MQTRLRSGLRAAATALVGALVLVGGAGAAPAADGRPVIDPGATGSITIHKLEYPHDALNLPHDGMDQGTVTGATPMSGVQFTVQQVAGYDLTTNAGWTALTDLTVAAAQGGAFGTQKTVTTGPDGVAAAPELPVGVYLVTETIYPTGATPVDPFLITVPLTNPDNDAEWVYDVHVYPKNPISTVTKTISDAGAAKLGDPVTWTILGDIPQADPIDGYRIVDHLDSKLTYVGTRVALSNGAAITLGADYAVTTDGSTTVTVEFTAAGRAKLAAQAADRAQVVVEIRTKVNTIGEIANEALLYPNACSFDIAPGEPGGPTVTPEVESKWGNVTIHKVDKTTRADLAGAEFSIFQTRADAVAGRNPIRTLPTAADGTLTFTGLRYSEWADGGPVAVGDPGYQSYWIAETKAPDGYELLAAPIEVVVASTDTAVDYTVENVPNNGGFTLPLTGGVGTAALTAAGVLLIAGALFLVIRHRRREAIEG